MFDSSTSVQLLPFSLRPSVSDGLVDGCTSSLVERSAFPVSLSQLEEPFKGRGETSFKYLHWPENKPEAEVPEASSSDCSMHVEHCMCTCVCMCGHLVFQASGVLITSVCN